MEDISALASRRRSLPLASSTNNVVFSDELPALIERITALVLLLDMVAGRNSTFFCKFKSLAPGWEVEGNVVIL